NRHSALLHESERDVSVLAATLVIDYEASGSALAQRRRWKLKAATVSRAQVRPAVEQQQIAGKLFARIIRPGEERQRFVDLRERDGRPDSCSRPSGTDNATPCAVKQLQE